MVFDIPNDAYLSDEFTMEIEVEIEWVLLKMFGGLRKTIKKG